MKCLLTILLLGIAISTIPQNSDCYRRLLLRGSEEFDKNNLKEAILKWQTAKENCPGLTIKEKQFLDELINKAKDKETSQLIMVPVKDTIIKIIVKKDTVYIEKPVEKIVYRDRPEPYHEFGKGKGKLVITAGCSTNGTIEVWVDGEYWGGLTKSYFTAPGCDATESLSRRVLIGKHHVKAKGQPSSWEFYTIVTEDDCNVRYLTCPN
jgi:hypothetical protein